MSLQPEPVRRPDVIGADRAVVDRWFWWFAAVSVLCLVMAMVADACGPGAAARQQRRWQHRQRQHELQTKACLDARGVPYFDDQGLFSRCAWADTEGR